MRKLTWRTQLIALFALILGVSLLVQSLCTMPTIRNRERLERRSLQERGRRR